jgi:hypothetical protein
MLARLLLAFCLLFISANPGFAATYFSDDCNDTDGVTLASHTPDTGTSWTVIQTTGASGTMNINTNGCAHTSTSASSGHIYTADGTYSTANYAVQATISRWDAASTQLTWLGCRVVAGIDGYFVGLQDDSQNPDVLLYRSDDSVATQLGTANTGLVATDVVSLECSGSSITVKKNGTAIIGPITDATYSAAGEAILGAGDILDITAFSGTAGANHRVDDFTVTSIESRRAVAPVMFQ